jgi:hypothetical protein
MDWEVSLRFQRIPISWYSAYSRLSKNNECTKRYTKRW